MPVINQFTNGSTTINLGQNPTRESSRSGQGYQPTGLDSSGSLYVYDKARIIRNGFRLIFPGLSAAILAQLLDFQKTVARGNQTPFTWYDHEGARHTVRMVEQLRSREITAGRYRVELSLEEDTAWTPATDTDLLTTYAAPLWILKMTVNAVVYFFADSTLYIPAWGITTLPWVSSWGSVQGGISGGLGEYQTTDLSVSLIIVPDSVPNMEDLALSYPLEESPAELYLYDCSGRAAPLLKFSGYVSEVAIPDETVVTLTIEDQASRLQTYIGRKLTTTDYPGADPDDVGKVINIVTGFVPKVPALCTVSGWASTITADMTSGATALTVSEMPLYPLIGKTIVIDAEQMTVTGQQYANLTVSRGANSTLATAHAARTVALEIMTAPLVYLAADHPVDSFGSVFARVGGIDVNITSACTRYTGQGGANDYSGYAGKAVVTISDIPAVRNKINLVLTEVGHAHNTSTSTTEATTLSLPAATVYSSNYPQPSGYPYTPGASMYKTVTFPASGGTRSSCSYSITFTPSQTHNTAVLIIVNGVCKWWSDMNLYSGSPFTVTFTANAGGEANANSIDIVTVGAGLGSIINVTASSRMVYLSSVPSTASFSGASLSGNSVSDTVIGEGLFVNIHNIQSIETLFGDLLDRAGMANTTLAISGGVLNSSWTAGAEMVVNGGFASAANWNLRLSLILNGTFNGGTAPWTLYTGASISAGLLNANIAGSAYVATQPISITSGKTVLVLFEIKNYVSGSVRAQLQSAVGPYRSANSLYGENITSGAAETFMGFSTSGGFVGSIENVQVLNTTDSYVTISSGLLNIFMIDRGVVAIQNDITLASGQRYELAYQVSAIDGGSVKVEMK